MTYESTGEVRAPRKGEMFLCQHGIFSQLTEAAFDWGPVDQEVIMRPVREEEPVKEWQVTIPFASKAGAEGGLEWIKEVTNFGGMEIVPIYE